MEALDRCIAQDWDGAKAALEECDDPASARLAMLITLEQKREAERHQKLAMTRHELGNRLSVAQANLEAMMDGVLDITPERLNAIIDSLRGAGAVVVDLKTS